MPLCQTDASRVYELMGEGHPACETDSKDLLSTRVIQPPCRHPKNSSSSQR